MNEYQSQIPRSSVSQSIAGFRLAAGLLQGFILYLLYHAVENKVWTPGNSWLLDILLLVVGFVPVFLIIGLGHMPTKSLWRWLIPAALALTMLAYYDWWRSIGAPDWRRSETLTGARYPSVELLIHVWAGFFIAKSMVLAASMDRKRIASYHSYFESSWKLLIQIAFAVVFTGVFWLVLQLGASLFEMIKLNFLKDILEKSWFAIPVTTFAFAYALHITDVRPGIVSGIRSLLLVLLSWILPVSVLLIAGFLFALPFTGLEPLWATKQATALLLVAAALLVVLINAAFQDGGVAKEVAKLIKFSALAASMCLVPLVAIASYALSLRVGQYGWTTDRLVAAFCIVMAACYATGYLWASLRSTEWMSKVASVNVVAAFVALFLLFAIFSPLLDPARISVNSQLAQLNSGKISVAKFDYEYLRLEGKRFGNAALNELAGRKSGQDASVIAMKARAALEKSQTWNVEPEKIDRKLLAMNIIVRTPGAVLPESFLAQNWQGTINDKKWSYPECLHNSGKSCDAYLLDMDKDGLVEILLEEESNQLKLFTYTNGAWQLVGNVAIPNNCYSIQEALKLGKVTANEPRFQDIEILGQHYSVFVDANPKCPLPANKKTD
jgi:hypothetical protein